ncbi:MAG: hypothetical protein AAF630_02285 [Cyanobacteria bacterium P01_C01_bin.38]
MRINPGGAKCSIPKSRSEILETRFFQKTGFLALSFLTTHVGLLYAYTTYFSPDID